MRYTYEQAVEAVRQHPEIIARMHLSPTDLLIYREICSQGEPVTFAHLLNNMVTAHAESTIRKSLKQMVKEGYILRWREPDNSPRFVPFTTTKECPKCGSTALVSLNTLSLKICTDCQIRITWLRLPGEEAYQ